MTMSSAGNLSQLELYLLELDGRSNSDKTEYKAVISNQSDNMRSALEFTVLVPLHVAVYFLQEILHVIQDGLLFVVAVLFPAFRKRTMNQLLTSALFSINYFRLVLVSLLSNFIIMFMFMHPALRRCEIFKYIFSVIVWIQIVIFGYAGAFVCLYSQSRCKANSVEFSFRSVIHVMKKLQLVSLSRQLTHPLPPLSQLENMMLTQYKDCEFACMYARQSLNEILIALELKLDALNASMDSLIDPVQKQEGNVHGIPTKAIYTAATRDIIERCDFAFNQRLHGSFEKLLCVLCASLTMRISAGDQPRQPPTGPDFWRFSDEDITLETVFKAFGSLIWSPLARLITNLASIIGIYLLLLHALWQCERELHEITSNWLVIPPAHLPPLIFPPKSREFVADAATSGRSCDIHAKKTAAAAVDCSSPRSYFEEECPAVIECSDSPAVAPYLAARASLLRLRQQLESASTRVWLCEKELASAQGRAALATYGSRCESKPNSSRVAPGSDTGNGNEARQPGGDLDIGVFSSSLDTKARLQQCADISLGAVIRAVHSLDGSWPHIPTSPHTPDAANASQQSTSLQRDNSMAAERSWFQSEAAQRSPDERAQLLLDLLPTIQDATAAMAQLQQLVQVIQRLHTGEWDPDQEHELSRRAHRPSWRDRDLNNLSMSECGIEGSDDVVAGRADWRDTDRQGAHSPEALRARLTAIGCARFGENASESIDNSGADSHIAGGENAGSGPWTDHLDCDQIGSGRRIIDVYVGTVLPQTQRRKGNGDDHSMQSVDGGRGALAANLMGELATQIGFRATAMQQREREILRDEVSQASRETEMKVVNHLPDLSTVRSSLDEIGKDEQRSSRAAGSCEARGFETAIDAVSPIKTDGNRSVPALEPLPPPFSGDLQAELALIMKRTASAVGDGSDASNRHGGMLSLFQSSNSVQFFGDSDSDTGDQL